MAIPTLEDLADGMESTCMARLGDTVQYRPVGGMFTSIKGYVDYGESMRDLGTGQIIAQDITVELLHSDVPVRPSPVSRIQLAKLNGQTFRPTNVRNSESGDAWVFELERVNG